MASKTKAKLDPQENFSRWWPTDLHADAGLGSTLENLPVSDSGNMFNILYTGHMAQKRGCKMAAAALINFTHKMAIWA